ncbi:hypothetical protein [Streptomyces sp. NPDC048269]|uniref:hypothetical protein n=1 Tax=Streptomyces sp. NPDC048269 TaxID=3155753 RepID=UPI00343AA60C
MDDLTAGGKPVDIDGAERDRPGWTFEIGTSSFVVTAPAGEHLTATALRRLSIDTLLRAAATGLVDRVPAAGLDPRTRLYGGTLEHLAAVADSCWQAVRQNLPGREEMPDDGASSRPRPPGAGARRHARPDSSPSPAAESARRQAESEVIEGFKPCGPHPEQGAGLWLWMSVRGD